MLRLNEHCDMHSSHLKHIYVYICDVFYPILFNYIYKQNPMPCNLLRHSRIQSGSTRYFLVTLRYVYPKPTPT